MPHLPVTKTYKLFINGAFPRSESGRSLAVNGRDGAVIGHVCRASRKDLRDAVEAARVGRERWAAATAYNRGQVIYRMAEMLEGRREDFAALLAATIDGGLRGARREVEASIDRLVCFAGWADKLDQVIGCRNPVAGPYHNFSFPEPSGVVALLCPDEPALLGLITMIAPPLCAGNALVVIAGDRHPLAAALFAEVCATSDVPPGAINLLTGKRSELLEHAASHREIDTVAAAGLSAAQRRLLETEAADSIKRTHVIRRRADDWFDDDQCSGPWTIEPFVEIKTIWHPAGL